MHSTIFIPVLEILNVKPNKFKYTIKDMNKGGVKNNKTSAEFLEGPEPKTRVVERCSAVID